MRLSNPINPSHRLSMSSRRNDGLPKHKKLFPTLKERLELQRDRVLNIDTDDLQFNTFHKYRIRRL